MEEKNQAGNSWSGEKPQTGGVPPQQTTGTPPTGDDKLDPNISLRTIESDVKSIGDSGGSEPRPFTPSTPKQAPPKPEMKKSPKGPSGGGSFTPPNNVPSPAPELEKPKKKSNRGLFIGIIAAIVIVGIAAVVYFFIVPLVSDTEEITTPTEEETMTTEETEEGAPPVTEELEESDVPEETEEVVTPEEPEVTVPVLTNEVHASFFKNPADISVDFVISGTGATEIHEKLTFNPTENPLLREVVLKGSENKPVSFEQVASTLAPQFFTSEMTGKFESDFTLFTYTNTAGTWMGLVAKLADGVELGEVQGTMSNLQKDLDLKNFFVSNPGEMGVWEDGSVKGLPTSLVKFSNEGAALSYTWFDSYLLLSTNLDGAAEAATLLGF